MREACDGVQCGEVLRLVPCDGNVIASGHNMYLRISGWEKTLKKAYKAQKWRFFTILWSRLTVHRSGRLYPLVTESHVTTHFIVFRDMSNSVTLSDILRMSGLNSL
ncbi:hypothetical protein KIN20_011548 [Parelaphostrongylus tenuis]|uniref:Uncharacterized protein n=1 Tax=Parelaphostrongylus tenuis TaxID=148309 RepID=A0AAD5QPY1_PARTN|nr:hypothetical protein KIN20_011548 [Parelaphostrongylus tenuis]